MLAGGTDITFSWRNSTVSLHGKPLSCHWGNFVCLKRSFISYSRLPWDSVWSHGAPCLVLWMLKLQARVTTPTRELLLSASSRMMLGRHETYVSSAVHCPCLGSAPDHDRGYKCIHPSILVKIITLCFSLSSSHKSPPAE